MEKMIITEFGRPIQIESIHKIVNKTMPIDEEKVIPYALFAVLENKEWVNIGNFYDIDLADIIMIILDIFSTDNKPIFDVNLEAYGVKSILDICKYVSCDNTALYQNTVKELKKQLMMGEFDVSVF